MKTADGVSPGVSASDVLISLIVFTLLYGALAVVEFKLLLKAIKAGPHDDLVDEKADLDKLTVAY
jgi:cytochrome d ubiquinol oxidase subunit I